MRSIYDIADITGAVLVWEATDLNLRQAIVAQCKSFPRHGITARKTGFEPGSASVSDRQGESLLHKYHRLPQNFDIAQQSRELEGYVGSEIEQAIIDAMDVKFNVGREFTREDIRVALKRQVPLSKFQRETIEALHNWLREE